jgi:outer membrane protein OmpA-like peptidoglycan-associated protein
VRSAASTRPVGDQAASAAPARRPARAAGRSNRALARQAFSPDVARSLAPSLGNRATGALLQRASHCEAPPPEKYKSTPKEGRHREQTAPPLKPTVASLVGGKAWELYNFDVDKSFVKVQHEQVIRDKVVPAIKDLIQHDGAYAMVVGEASTTANWSHNVKLSEERAQCVIDVLKRELRAAGVKDLDKVLRPFWAGEAFSLIRRLQDEFEHEEDRLVTIIPVDRDPDQQDCTETIRKRASKRFKIKYACGGPGQVKINIGDVSVAGVPTYRKFRWITSPAETCRFRASTSGQAQWGARRKFSLALSDPDEDWAPSDLLGEASLDAGSGWLYAAGGKFSVKLKGKWPAGCKTSAGEVTGSLVADGKVLCGEVPQPEPDPSCEVTQTHDCTDDEKQAPATKFAAHMERFAADLPVGKLLRRLPRWAKAIIDELGFMPQGGIALVSIGIRQGPGPPRMRRFLFAGAGLDAAGWDGNVGFDKEAESSSPLSLATESPDDWSSASDFDHWVRARLEVTRGTNVEQLHVGGMTFDFHSAKCNGSSSTLYGYFGGVTSVDCEDIGDLPEPPAFDCGKDDCPDDTQLAEHDQFLFYVGRASVNELPVVGKRVADKLGCKVVAARVNIGTVGAADPIYREFLFIGRRTGCRFDVDRGFDDERYTFGRRLSITDPDDELDRSDFSGLATLKADGTLAVRPLSASTGYSIKLPGSFDGACTGGREIEGALIPVDDVKCGEVPVARHDTTPDDTGLELCQGLAAADAPTKREIERLRNGDYDYIVDHIDALGMRPLLEYTDELQTLATGQVLRHAVFVGRNFEGVGVVTIVEMQVVLVIREANGNVRVSVRFLSDACSYDEDGNAVFVLPFECKETLPYKGLFTPLQSVTAPKRPKKDPPPPDPDDARTAALEEPVVAVLG